MKHKILLLILLVTKACIINAFGEDFDEKKHPDVRELSPVQVTDIPDGDIPLMEKVAKLAHDSSAWKSGEMEKYYDIIENDIYYYLYSPADNWYCWRPDYSVCCNSCLKQNSNENFEGANADDKNLKTAWIAPFDKNGIKPKIEFSFSGKVPYITDVFIFNGHVRDKKSWERYGRARKILVKYEDSPIAVLVLENSRAFQKFNLGKLGHYTTESHPDWTLSFEIIDIFDAQEKATVALTEIFFEGQDW